MSAFVFAAVLGLGALLLVAPIIPAGGQLSVGAVAPQTLVAQRSATFESNALTETARDSAAENVAPAWQPPDLSLRDRQRQQLDRFLGQVRTIRARGGSLQSQLNELNQLEVAANIKAPGRTALLALAPAGFASLEQNAPQALAAIMNQGIEERADPATDARAREEAVEAYLSRSEAPSTDSMELNALQELLLVFVAPNVSIDEERTRQARQGARDAVAPQSVTFTRGQVIAGQGSTLDAADIEALMQTGYLDEGFDPYRVAAGATLSAGFAVLIGIFVFLLQPFPAAPVRRMLVTGAVILAALVAVRAVLPIVLPDQDHLFLAFAVPVAAAAMVAVSFADLPFAAIVAVLVGLFAAYIGASTSDLTGSDFTGSLEAFELAAAYIATGLVGALTLQRAERLTRFALSAITVSLAAAAVMGAFWLASEPRDTGDLAWIALAAGLCGLLSAVITVGCFVVLSMAFGVTTRLQLMELAQSDHALLRRLQDQAPGTYHHSIMVGTLAERAAANIGADALVAKVGAYYHDIGKLAQPTFYIENTLDGAASPHDVLEPEESARIIREHVANGLEIARKHRLPAIVRDFIPQHHGTRLVTYFYRRAAHQGSDVDAAAFRYGGPRPQSKESAIVMLADSCEALVRASQRDERARTRLDELIDSVFAERLAEGQLDECDITMRELQQVAASFKATLRAVYHPRIEYPSPAPEEIALLARTPVAQQD